MKLWVWMGCWLWNSDFLFFLVISHALSESGGAIWARELIGNVDTLKSEPHDCTLHLVVPFELKSSLAIGDSLNPTISPSTWWCHMRELIGNGDTLNPPRSHPPPGCAIWAREVIGDWDSLNPTISPSTWWCHLNQSSLAIGIFWTPWSHPPTGVVIWARECIGN